MDRRTERRLNLELPVRIWGVDRMARPFAEIVRVGNVSNRGAVLLGMRSKVQSGDLLDVQLGASRAQFRIVWMSLSDLKIVRVGNVSNRGAVLLGMRSKVQSGDLLDVQLGASRAQFRIVWMSL